MERAMLGITILDKVRNTKICRIYIGKVIRLSGVGQDI